jgi:hypothetical protein
MGNKIIIQAGNIRAEAELNESKTAELIWKALPIEAKANTWGDEVYFDIPVKTGLENGVEVVQVGDLGYWPTGAAFCIFFGPTPMSRGNEIRPASAVNLVGKVVGDARAFRAVSDGERVKLTRSE